MITMSKEETTTFWKNKLTAGIDTYDLQVESLVRFLDALGYEVVCSRRNFVTHIIRKDKSDNPKFMSFSTAVALHNGCFMNTNGTIFEARGFTFLRKDFDLAYHNKILRCVYLQRDKKESFGIKTLTNWVKFHQPYNLNEEMERTY